MLEPRGEIRLNLETEIENKTEHEQDIELDEIGKEGFGGRLFRATGADSASFLQELGELSGERFAADEQLIATNTLENAESAYVEGARTQTIGTDPKLSVNTELVRLLHEAIAQRPEKGIFWQRFKFLSFAFGLAVPAYIGIIISAITAYYVKGQTDVFEKQLEAQLPRGLTEENKAYIRMLVKRWVEEDKQTDDQIWESMAKYVDQWQPSVEGQMEFMSYLKTLSAQTPWTWRARDQIAKVDELEDAYLSNKRFSDIYRTVKGITYQQPGTASPTRLPRFQAADLCDRALSNIHQNLQIQGSQ